MFTQCNFNWESKVTRGCILLISWDFFHCIMGLLLMDQMRNSHQSAHVAIQRSNVCTCVNAVRTKLSHASYKHTHTSKPVSRGVLIAYKIFCKAQNRLASLLDTRPSLSFVCEKSSNFFSPIFVSLYSFQFFSIFNTMIVFCVLL